MYSCMVVFHKLGRGGVFGDPNFKGRTLPGRRLCKTIEHHVGMSNLGRNCADYTVQSLQ